MLLHREHDLYVAEKNRGRALQDLIRNRLRTDRFSKDDADEWAFRNWYRWLIPAGEPFNEEDDPWVCEQVVEAALAFRRTGMPIDGAFAWTIRDVTATKAVRARQQGWNPHAYSTLLTLCSEQTPDNGSAGAWVESGIAWWRALRYLQARIGLREALAHEERRHHYGDDVDTAVDLVLALTDAEEFEQP